MIIKMPSVFVGLANTLFSRRNRGLLLSSFALVITVNWLAASTHQMFNWLIQGKNSVKFPWYEAVYPVIFIVAFLWAKRCYRKLSSASTLSVTARNEDCDGLVLFLSKGFSDRDIGAEEKDLAQLESSLGSESTLLLDSSWRANFKSHLRMPLEALAFHFGRKAGKKIPKRVTLLASRESIKFAPLVREAFEHLIRPLSADTRVIAIEGVGTGNWGNGIEYANPSEVVAVLDAVYSDHEKNKISPSEVVVDVTGGSSLGSVIASMTALKSGRRVEYTNSDFSRENYSVRVFDLEYTEPVKSE